MKSILIWGIGDRTEHFMMAGYFRDCQIKGFIDTYAEEKTYRGYDVYKPAHFKSIVDETEYIIIANEFYAEIFSQCYGLGIDLKKIVITDHVLLEPYYECFLRLKEVSLELFETLEKYPFILVKANEFDRADKNMRMSQGKYKRTIYMQDYFRYRTFELVAEELKAADIPGDIAELGVFRGEFSSLINDHFPDRNLFLFDTFEGFESEEAEKELKLGRCDEDFITGHTDTSVERMLSNLPHPEKAKVCKGVFPESITNEAKSAIYAFVSLDVDFEESTYQGLNFFYPRMSQGGMIFVHDYNTYFLDGIKRAVGRYEKELGINLKKVPIADRAGTLIILK